MIFKRHIEPGDKVMHAYIAGAPLTVIKSGGKEVTPLAIREAGEIAAAYSSAWKGGLAAVDVYWVSPDQVSQSAESGEHLAKGSFVIRGKKNFIKKVDLKVSIGVVILKNEEGIREARAVAGNTQAMSKHSTYFITVTPGVMEQNDAGKEVKKRLAMKAMPDDKVLIEALPIEDFVKLVPAGKSFVTG
jgi:ABC-type Na+ efflux pump permease subunit